MNNIIPADHLRAAIRFRQTVAAFEKNRDLISVGAYRRGSDPSIDYAIEKYPEILRFLQQGAKDKSSLEDSKAQLFNIMREDARQ
jgi:flagellum-specific ATP synthase